MRNFNKAVLTLSVLACAAMIACGKKGDDSKAAPTPPPAPGKLTDLQATCKANKIEVSYKKDGAICNGTAERTEAKTLTKIAATFILGKKTAAEEVALNLEEPVEPLSASPPPNPGTPSNPSNPSTPTNPSNPSNPSSIGTLLKVDITVDAKGEISGIDGELTFNGKTSKLKYDNPESLKNADVKSMFDLSVEMLKQLNEAGKKCDPK